MTKRPDGYGSWVAMRMRCHWPKHKNYNQYGGRGIKVCERWRSSLHAFLADMGPRPSPVHSIERIDNDGDYEPGNCRWATQGEQANNRQVSRHVEFNGARKTVAQWAQEYGLGKSTLGRRLNLGWPIELALTKPRRRRSVVSDADRKEIQHSTEPTGVLAKRFGLHRATIKRIRHGAASASLASRQAPPALGVTGAPPSPVEAFPHGGFGRTKCE